MHWSIPVALGAGLGLAATFFIKAANASPTPVTDQTYYGGKYDRPEPRDPCHIPIFSERTGELLYFNRGLGCWEIPDDGDSEHEEPRERDDPKDEPCAMWQVGRQYANRTGGCE